MFRLSFGRMTTLGTLAGASALLVACGDNAAAPNTSTQPPAAVEQATPTPTVTPGVITGEWASLQSAIGQYPSQSKLLENSVLATPLKTLLGDKFDVFRTNLQVESPLQKDGDVLFLSGNKQHEGGSEAAYLLVHPQTKALEVGLWQGGKLEVLKTPGSDIRKPTDIQTMISNAAN